MQIQVGTQRKHHQITQLKTNASSSAGARVSKRKRTAVVATTLAGVRVGARTSALVATIIANRKRKRIVSNKSWASSSSQAAEVPAVLETTPKKKK